MTIPVRVQTDWRAVLAATFCGVAVAISIGKVPIAMPQLRAEFALSLVAAGWVASMVNMLGVSTGLMFGVLGDRVGALRMCFAGLAFNAIGGLAAVFAGNEMLLLISRFLEGAGVLCVAVSAPALLSAASTPRDRSFALGIWSTYLPVGVSLIMLLAPLAIPAGGWRSLWWVAIGVALVAGLTLYLCRSAYRLPAPAHPDVHPFLAAKEALAQPAPWLLALAMATFTVQHYALIIWLPTILKEQRDLSALAVSLLSCLMVLVSAPGTLFGGYLLQRHFRRSSLIAVASIVTGLSGAGIFLDLLPDLVRYALCLALSFTGALIPASVLSASAIYARRPKQISTLQGLFTQFSNLGPFFGPPIIAMLVSASGLWRDALWVTGSAALIGVALGLRLRVYERR